MVYAWKVNGKLAFEFHSKPDQEPSKDYYESYELDDKVGKDASLRNLHRSLHGNPWMVLADNSNKDIEFRLMVADFFDCAKMFVDGNPDDVPVEDVK